MANPKVCAIKAGEDCTGNENKCITSADCAANNKRCKCMETHEQVNGKICVEQHTIGTSCNGGPGKGDCEPTNSVCTNSECQCEHDENASLGATTCKGGAAGLITPVTALIVAATAAGWMTWA